MRDKNQVLHVAGKKSAGLAIQVSVVTSPMMDGYLVKMQSGHKVGQLTPVQSVVVDTYAEAVQAFGMYVQCMNIAMGGK